VKVLIVWRGEHTMHKAMLCPSTKTALLGVLLALASVSSAFASSSSTNEHHLEDPSNVGGVRGSTAEAHGSPGGYRRLQQAITVNVNFVNFKNSAGEGATEAQVRAQMDVLNAAFRGNFVFNYTIQDVTNDAIFGNIDSDAAGRDPTETQMKQQYKRGNRDTLSVYSVSLVRPGKNTVGWAYTPEVDVGFQDGIVMEWRTVPGVSEENLGMVSITGAGACICHFHANSRTLSCPFDQTLVHEAGHWLNLQHTFQGGCNPPGDNIADTPAELKAFHTCDDPKRDSCPDDQGPDPVTNYMTYVPDRCYKEFTKGQFDAMRAAWNTHRAPRADPPPEPGAARGLAATSGATKTGGSFKVVQEIRHDPKAHTQSLQHYFCWSHGPNMTFSALESIGKYGSSSLRKVDIFTGEVLQKYDLPTQHHAQGVTYIPPRNHKENGRVVQLTWREKTGFLYDPYSLDQIGRFQYSTSTKQGWGIAFRHSHRTLLVTDGSALLHTWNADTLKEVMPRRKIHTRPAGSGTTKPLTKVHELEWDKRSGTLLGIVYKYGTIVRIDPDTGLVKNMYNVSGLYPNRAPGAGPLTGITLTSVPGEVWVTGKHWPKSYRIKLID
jgi:glutamine cyclotransferase